LCDPNSNRYKIITSGGFSLVAGKYTIIRKTECYDSSSIAFDFSSWHLSSPAPPNFSHATTA
jgi:hypothetical protein